LNQTNIVLYVNEKTGILNDCVYTQDMLTVSGHSKILSILGERNHILNTTEKIEHQILQENRKRNVNNHLGHRKFFKPFSKRMVNF